MACPSSRPSAKPEFGLAITPHIDTMNTRHRRPLLTCLSVLLSLFVSPGAWPAETVPPLPVAAAYHLPILGQAGDGEVLTTRGQSRHLHDYLGDKLTILSFIYATCSDEKGCPLATRTLHKVSARLGQDAEIGRKVRLITLSFDPVHDTPEAMRHYGESLGQERFDWAFLTTRNEAALSPLLAAYPQDVRKIYNPEGQFTGTYSHLLRVYLIDKARQIRNIYSADLLQPELLMADIQSLLKPQASAPIQSSTSLVLPADNLYRSGDDRESYEQPGYRSHSTALPHRTGKPADLLAFAKAPQFGLPKLTIPVDNPLTRDTIALGRKLFYDRRLSFNNTVSCALCHIPEQGFTSHEMATAVGVEGRTVRRNSPSLYNVGYAALLFQDGRENRLEQQVWGPLLARNEMANPSVGHVIDKLNADPEYPGLFLRAFGKKPGMETLGMALASYQRTLRAADSPFDRWYFGKQAEALDTPAIKGFFLFTGKAGCSQCHTLNPRYALFSDSLRHNTGTGYAETLPKSQGKRRITVAPGVFLDVDSQAIQAFMPPPIPDMGYYEISQNPGDRWAYKTPSLRNIALTAPYMHDGSIGTLAGVVDFYNQGGIPNENLSPAIRPLGLTDNEKSDLLSFLQSLTSPHVKTLIADAYVAPVGDSR